MRRRGRLRGVNAQSRVEDDRNAARDERVKDAPAGSCVARRLKAEVALRVSAGERGGPSAD